MKQNQTITRLGIILGPLMLVLLCSLVAFWVGRQVSGGNGTPVVDIPAPRPTATLMSTPTSTATPTPLPTATATPTATFTPTSTPKPVPTIEPKPIRDLGRLITADQEFTVWVPYHNKPDWWPLPFWHNDFILFAVGRVQAGVDLDKLQDEDFAVSGSRVQITLAPPEIFGDPNLDLDQTEVLEGSSFNPISMDWNEMISAQREAEAAILKKAGETELLKTARQNAEDRIELLLRRLGATEVTIKWRDIYF